MAASSQSVTTTGAFNFGTLNLNMTYTDQTSTTTRTLSGVAATVLNSNSAVTVAPPFGGFAFVSLSAVPSGGEPISIVDANGSSSTFGLVGGLVQH